MKSIFPPLASAIRSGAVAFCAASMVISPASLMAALPSALQVSHGQLDLSHSAGTLHIDQLTPQAIANWQSFNIGEGNTVNINQLDAQSVLLNRVLGADPSKIMGQLNANGRVFLVNPNGIVVGRNASVNTAEFIASALDISDEDFLNGGDRLFFGDSTQSVVNLGTITADNGDVILIAYKVANEGEIEASQGVAALAAGNSVLLTPEGDQRILVKLGLETTGGDVGVENSGLISAAQAELKAAGGNIYELAINQTGIIHATGVERRDGRVLLTAESGTVAHQGTIAARDADGSGGEVLIGGDYRGENAAVANAARTIVTEDARIDVSATAANADAGRAIVWAEEATRFLGTISGRGGVAGGDGAFAEVSGKKFLDFQGSADLRAPMGTNGQLLLDPASLTVQITGETNLSSPGGDPFTFTQADSNAPSILRVATLQAQLDLSDVVLDTSAISGAPGNTADGSIVVNDPVAWFSGNRLIFNSGNSIAINANLTSVDQVTGAGNGDIVFGLGYVNSGDSGSPVTFAELTVAPTAVITADQVSIRRNINASVPFTNGFGSIGTIDIRGALDIDTLNIEYVDDGNPSPFAAAISGLTNINNANNKIGNLTTTGATRSIIDDFSLVDSEGGLNIDGSFFVENNTFTLSTVGDLTLSAGTSITTTDADIYLAAQGGSFINNGGANAVDAQGTGRFLIYSDDPASTTKGGLVGAPVYDKTFAADAPGLITQTGDRFLYSLAPTLTLTANNTARTVEEPNPVFTYSVSGLVGGDAEVDVFSGDPELSTDADGASPVGTYAIDIANGTLALSDYNYGLELLPGLLTIDPAALRQLIIKANNAFRFYGDADPDFDSSYTGFRTGDNESVVSGLQYSTTANLQSTIGNYTITPFGAAADGYAIEYQPGTLQINPRLLTISAAPVEKFYGDTVLPLAPTFNNLASFDTAASLGALTLATVATNQFADAGSYPIVASGAANPNYSISYAPGTATVNPRPATITAVDATREYGLANPAFTATEDGIFVTDFDPADLTYASAAQTDGIGDYAITVSGFNDTNYAITYEPGQLEITPALLTLTANSFIREYGLANPAFTFGDSGFRLSQSIGDVVNNIQLTSAATQASGVDTYPINISGEAFNPNYSVSFTPGSLEITKAPLTINPALSSRFYGDANPTNYDLAATGLRNGDTAAVVFGEQFQNFTAPDANVGTTGTVTITAADALNYALTFAPGTMNILARPITITADGFTREYGEANPTFTASFDNLASFETASVFSNLSLTTPATPGSNVLEGGYGINVSSDPNPNYAITYVPGILDITPAPLLVELGNVARFYGDANPSPTADVAVGFKNGETISDLNLQVVTTATPTTEVGTFGYNATTFNPNYTLNITGGLLTIEPAPLTLTMRSVTRLYGETNPEPELISIGGLKFPATNEAIVSVSNPTTPGTDAGRYDFVASVLNPNYRLDGFVGDIFISPRPLSIVISGSRAFGDPDPAPSAFSITGNFVNGDQGADEIDFRYTTPFLVDQDIGSYDITAETNILSNTGNYLPSLTSNTLQITPRFIDVSVSDLARLYGDANPTLTLDSTTNIPLFESVEDVVRLSTPADPFSAAGAYAIDAELINANYQFNFLENGVLTVSPREIVILIDNKARDYGDLNPAFTARYTRDGFASFDDPNAFVSFASVANQETDAGNYGITADLSNLDPTRYTIDSVVNGNLRIDPRPIGIDFGNLDRIYGDTYTDTDITVTSGSIPIFLTPQEFVADLGGLPAPDADVGSYAVNEFVFSPNYDVSADSVRDFLIINPRTLTVTVESFARFFGDANPTFTAAFGGDGLSEFLQSQATLTPQTRQATNAVSNAGFYLINLSDSALNDPNFNFIEINPGVLSVLPRPYTIDIADDALALDFGTSFDGLGNFDESAVRFRAAINNVPAFVNLNELAGGLTFEINEVNVPFPVEQVIPPEEFVAPNVSIFEDRGNFVSVSDAGVPTSRPFIASRDGASTSALTEVVEVIPIEIGGSGAVVVTGEFEPIDPELGTLPLNVTTPDTITRSFFINLATSTSSNQNLTLAGVTPGVLTLRTRTNIEQISYELNRAVEVDRVSRESLVIRAPSDYQVNIGLILADFPDMTFDMLNTYFQTLLSGEGPFYFEADSLFFSIFGKTSGNLADLDPAAIRSWMSDIATNPEKRSQMGSVLIDYLQQMQAIDWKDRTPAQKILVDSVAAKVQEKQQAFVNRLLEKEKQFEATPNASRAYYNARDTADVFEKRAAVAAKDFLHYERDTLTEGEIAVLEAIQYSIVDGDRMSSLALLEQWFEVRGDRKGDALIDGQFEGFIRELTDTKVGMDRARAAIESGVDHGGPEGAMTTNMAGAHDFLNIELPYGDLLKESSYAGLEAKMARYDSYGDTAVLTSLGASTVAGVATGAGIVSAAGSVQTVGRVVFPYVKKAAAAGGRGASAVGGAVAIVAATTYVFVEGMTALIQHEEQKEIYTSIVDELGGNVNITDIDFAPETTDVFADDPKPSDIVNHLKKSLLVEALDEMILGV